MASSPEAIPVKLPLPPSAPTRPKGYRGHGPNADSVAARALAALDDDDDSSSLDVYIRWKAESGTIVQKGERIAQLLFSYHGTPPPPSGVSSGNNNGTSIIRARMKTKRGGTVATSVGLQPNAQAKGEASSKDSNYVNRDLRSPANGFLRIVYTKSHAQNAVHIKETAVGKRFTPINLILAAIEPCEHPSAVGGLCAVCGADMRKSTSNSAGTGWLEPIPRKPGARTMPNREAKSNPKAEAEIRQQQIIEKQRNLAASMTSSKDFDDDDDEFACFDMDAAIAGRSGGSKQSSFGAAKQPPAPKVAKPAAAPLRSLSSLLSGAKATQQMQQNPPTKKTPMQQGQAAARRRQMAASASSSATGHDSMTKMTVSGGVTISVSEKEAKNISDASSKKLKEEKKLCLVLDLDHTLLHATDDYRAGRFVAEEVYDEPSDDTNGSDKMDDTNEAQKPNEPARKPNPDLKDDVRSILLPVELPLAQQQQYVQQKLEQQKQDDSNFCLSPLPQQQQVANSSIIMRHYVKLRPHLKEFFAQIQDTYQLSVYTAGTRSYAEQVAVMICRHLVGTTCDEEGLNVLRGRVREKEEECRKYRAHKAKAGRKRQLELLKEREDQAGEAEMAESQKKGARKAVSFGKCVDKETGGATEVIDLTSSSSGDGEMHVPRKKKKRVESGSLLTDIAAGTGSEEKKEGDPENQIDAEDEHLADPSAERDRLRKELEEAEKLEIAAVELRRKIFGSRIVSRSDVGDLGKDVKSLKRVFPCGGVMAAILDDREDVWANAKNNVTGRPGEPPDNLLLVKPYHWKPFRGYADVNNASGQDLSKTDDTQQSGVVDDKEDDEQLLWTADILRRLRERYYSPTLSKQERASITVPNVLQSMRRDTLLCFPQVKMVLSGLIPIHKQNKLTQVRPNVVRYAEELGAEILPNVTAEVTHVVAARDNSEKVKQARKEVRGCYIVHTSWLMECYWSLTRRDVQPHHMGPMPSQKHLQQRLSNATKKEKEKPKGGVVVLLDSEEESSDEDDFDDDFAADFEKEMLKKG
ncbi:hypothetical protein ACHAXT_002538 [Thalassiosira profunda]